MATAGIHIVEPKELQPAERDWLERQFLAQLPADSDAARRRSRRTRSRSSRTAGLTVGVELRRERDGTTMHALLPIPGQLARFIRLPRTRPHAGGR